MLLVNWDNYPNSSSGGVYAWAKQIVDNLADTEFLVLNILSNPNVSGSYSIPKNVSRVIEVPLYGCQRYEEFCSTGRFVSKVRSTDERFIRNQFIPLFGKFIKELISDTCNYGQMGQLVYAMHQLLTGHDVKKCVEHPLSFSTFTNSLNRDELYRTIQMKEAVDLFQFIQRILQILSVDLPQVDLVHASNAWIPALAGLCAKMRYNCPMIATEHGVAFKDLLLYHQLFIHNEAYNILWKVLSSNIIKTIYQASDIVAPVCEANAAAAQMLDTSQAKIRVIYNGVDNTKFRPMQQQHKASARRPTIVFVGRIELLKDVLSLIQAISYVKQSIPDVQCLIYGSSTDIEYANTCLQMVRDLKLQDNVRFMGATKNPEQAYNAGDVVVLSSIREGFPYTVVEAMSCGKVVVSTDVGGVKEALENYGMLVRSRHPYELASALVRVLADEKTRKAMEAAALEQVSSKFTIHRAVEQYRNLYTELLNPASSVQAWKEKQ
ncbi:MAG: GT4 family glycosyltransferase PelF [Nitrososphaera sp.]